MHWKMRQKTAPLCLAALTLFFVSRAGAGEAPARFDETGTAVLLPTRHLAPLVQKLEDGKRCAEELPLAAGVRDALYEENGALRAALDACAEAASAGAGEAANARQTIELDEKAAAACQQAREADGMLLKETQKENEGLRLTLAGIKWIIWAVGAAAGAILLLH